MTTSVARDEQFTVRVGEFEGPLTVLLNLVEERKLHISQVSLAAVTDDFVAYMERLDSDQKAALADFIVVAATLMLIKSAALLPTIQITLEENSDMAELERRLKLYQEIKQLIVPLGQIFDRRPLYFPQRRRDLEPVFTPTPDLRLANLQAALARVLAELPPTELVPEITLKKIVSLEEIIADLSDRVQTALSLSFREFLGDKQEKINIIIGFLGVLELVKRGLIQAEQESHFADIDLQTAEPGLPRYH